MRAEADNERRELVLEAAVKRAEAAERAQSEAEWALEQAYEEAQGYKRQMELMGKDFEVERGERDLRENEAVECAQRCVINRMRFAFLFYFSSSCLDRFIRRYALCVCAARVCVV